MPSMTGERTTIRDWIDQSILIIGAARQGTALAEYLVRHGAQVILNDKRPASELLEARTALSDIDLENPGAIRWVFGGHPLNLLDDVTMVCISGGVPLTIPLIIEARGRGIPLSNDSQIFLQAKPCKVIGITGSAGKTTTTTLVGRIAAQQGNARGEDRIYRKVWVGGNIGAPLIANVDEMQDDDLAVMEISSFQLEIMTQSPDVAAVLNVTPNHLDRHGTMADYTAAKARILDFQSAEDAAILGRDDPGAMSMADHVKGSLYTFGIGDLPSDQFGTFYFEHSLYLRLADQKDLKVLDRSEIELRGEHNLLNTLAACAIVAAAGLPAASIPAGVRNFRGVPHRLEFVRNWGGADWYNDSIATAPERVIAAINSFDEPLILLVGGRDKNLPWEDFSRLVLERVDYLIAFGEAASKIVNTISAMKESSYGLKEKIQALHTKMIRRREARTDALTIGRAENLVEAVAKAASFVKPGDVVLLSPGGTSFDEFNDFEERGECFARWVRELP